MQIDCLRQAKTHERLLPMPYIPGFKTQGFTVFVVGPIWRFRQIKLPCMNRIDEYIYWETGAEATKRAANGCPFLG